MSFPSSNFEYKNLIESLLPAEIFDGKLKVFWIFPHECVFFNKTCIKTFQRCFAKNSSSITCMWNAFHAWTWKIIYYPENGKAIEWINDRNMGNWPAQTVLFFNRNNGFLDSSSSRNEMKTSSPKIRSWLSEQRKLNTRFSLQINLKLKIIFKSER